MPGTIGDHQLAHRAERILLVGQHLNPIPNSRSHLAQKMRAIFFPLGIQSRKSRPPHVQV